MPRYSFTRDDIVYPDEFDVFIAKLPTLMFKCIAAILWLTGCRISEALSLTWQNISVSEDPAGLVLSIPILKKRQKGPVMPRREVIIGATNKYYTLIIDYLKIAPRPKLFPISRITVNKAFTATGHMITPHILRHSRLTLLGRGGADITSLLSVYGGDVRSLIRYTHEKRVVIS